MIQARYCFYSARDINRLKKRTIFFLPCSGNSILRERMLHAGDCERMRIFDREREREKKKSNTCFLLEAYLHRWEGAAASCEKIVHILRTFYMSGRDKRALRWIHPHVFEAFSLSHDQCKRQKILKRRRLTKHIIQVGEVRRLSFWRLVSIYHFRFQSLLLIQTCVLRTRAT